MSASVTVRYFGGAAQAAGAPSGTLCASTVGELQDLIASQIGAGVLRQCTLLVDGLPNPPIGTLLVDGTVVDVLPPFAGG